MRRPTLRRSNNGQGSEPNDHPIFDSGTESQSASSKWSRVLRYAAEFKNLDEELDDFIKRRGGLNECASRFARRPAGC